LQFEPALDIFGAILGRDHSKQTSDTTFDPSLVVSAAKSDSISGSSSSSSNNSNSSSNNSSSNNDNNNYNNSSNDDVEVARPQLPFFAGIELEESLLSVAANTFSVAALHLRKMTLSVTRLESLICEDTVRYLTDPIVFNLCTLYELSCSPDVSTNKKKVLERVAKAYGVDDPVLNIRSLRLS